MKFELWPVPSPLANSQFQMNDLVIHSEKLKKNPLGDSTARHNYLMVPQEINETTPLVVHFSGYFGNGTQALNVKTLDDNWPQWLQQRTQNKKIKPAIHCFLDATTLFGGSQFIDSQGCGNYARYIQLEVMKALDQIFQLKKRRVIAMGASSGGYGALYHISCAGTLFTHAIALAPDSDFTTSLWGEYLKAAPWLQPIATVVSAKKFITSGQYKKIKNNFSVLNPLAMSLCYGAHANGHICYPFDLSTGDADKRAQAFYLQKDPIVFLKKQRSCLKNKSIYLSVGRYDEFNLFFGARKIQKILKSYCRHFNYSEFDGGHFNLNENKIELLAKVLK